MNLKTMFGTVFLSLFLAGSANADPKKDSQELYKWLCNKPKGYYEYPTPYRGIRGLVFRGISKEEDISKFDYKWRWDNHEIGIIFNKKQGCEDSFVKALRFDVKQYKESITPGARQYTEYSFDDLGPNGTIEKKARSLEALKRDRGFWFDEMIKWFKNDKSKSFSHISIRYPKGYVNENWGSASDEESKKVYESEKNFWMLRHNLFEKDKYSVQKAIVNDDFEKIRLKNKGKERGEKYFGKVFEKYLDENEMLKYDIDLKMWRMNNLERKKRIL